MADKKANQEPVRPGDADAQNQPGSPASKAEAAAAAAQFERDNSDSAIPTLTRFRLPRFFSSSAESSVQTPDELSIGELPDDPVKSVRPAPVPVTAIGKALAAHSANRHASPPGSVAALGSVTSFDALPEDQDASSNGAHPEEGVVALSESDFSALVEQIAGLTEQIREVNERESVVEKVFNTLHSELADYKNDFLYEHLKPVVRPLLFLFDSLEQFDGEVALAESSETGAHLTPETAGVLSAPVVRQNVHYFRDQLVEALHVCEVVLMDPPSGAFNSKLHKAVDVLPVSKEEDGQIVRVVRSGWYLNGQLLRPAEVVVGKFRAQS